MWCGWGGDPDQWVRIIESGPPRPYPGPRIHITRDGVIMATPKRNWSGTSESTRKRYTAYGTTPEKPSRASESAKYTTYLLRSAERANKSGKSPRVNEDNVIAIVAEDENGKIGLFEIADLSSVDRRYASEYANWVSREMGAFEPSVRPMAKEELPEEFWDFEGDMFEASDVIDPGYGNYDPTRFARWLGPGRDSRDGYKTFHIYKPVTDIAVQEALASRTTSKERNFYKFR